MRIYQLFFITLIGVGRAELPSSYYDLNPILQPFADTKYSVPEAAKLSFKSFEEEMFGPISRQVVPQGNLWPAPNDFLEVSISSQLKRFIPKLKSQFPRPSPARFFQAEEADRLFDSFRERLSDSNCLSDPNVATMAIFDEMWDQFKDLVLRVGRYRNALYFRLKYIDAQTIDLKQFAAQFDPDFSSLRQRALEAFKPFVSCLEHSMSMEFGDLNSDYKEIAQLTPEIHQELINKYGGIEKTAFYEAAVGRSELWISKATSQFDLFLEWLDILESPDNSVTNFYSWVFEVLLDQASMSDFTDFVGLYNRMVTLLDLKSASPTSSDAFLGSALLTTKTALLKLQLSIQLPNPEVPKNARELQFFLERLISQLMGVGSSRKTPESRAAVLEPFFKAFPVWFPVEVYGRRVLAFCQKPLLPQKYSLLSKNDRLLQAFPFEFGGATYYSTEIGGFKQSPGKSGAQEVGRDELEAAISQLSTSTNLPLIYGNLTATKFTLVSDASSWEQVLQEQTDLCAPFGGVSTSNFPWNKLPRSDQSKWSREMLGIQDWMVPLNPHGLSFEGGRRVPDTVLDSFLSLIGRIPSETAQPQNTARNLRIQVLEFLDYLSSVYSNLESNYLILKVLAAQGVSSEDAARFHQETFVFPAPPSNDPNLLALKFSFDKLRSQPYRWIFDQLQEALKIQPADGQRDFEAQKFFAEAQGKTCSIRDLQSRPPTDTPNNII